MGSYKKDNVRIKTLPQHGLFFTLIVQMCVCVYAAAMNEVRRMTSQIIRDVTFLSLSPMYLSPWMLVLWQNWQNPLVRARTLSILN